MQLVIHAPFGGRINRACAADEGAAIVFILTVAISRFISLGSVLAAMSAPLLILMLGEITPKNLAAQMPERWATMSIRLSLMI